MLGTFLTGLVGADTGPTSASQHDCMSDLLPCWAHPSADVHLDMQNIRHSGRNSNLLLWHHVVGVLSYLSDTGHLVFSLLCAAWPDVEQTWTGHAPRPQFCQPLFLWGLGFYWQAYARLAAAGAGGNARSQVVQGWEASKEGLSQRSGSVDPQPFHVCTPRVRLATEI